MIKRCFINSLGKIVYEIGSETPFEFALSKDRKFLIHIQSNSKTINHKEWVMYITGFNGQKYKVSYVKSIYNDIKAEYLADSVVTYRMEVNKSYLHGFKDLKNNVISTPKYHYIASFNDGMAVIGKENDLGEMRYGFVNNRGKIILEPTFRSKPSGFEAGISIVSGNEGAGFINKAGKIFAKAQNQMFSDPYRKNGYVFSKSSVADTTGKISTIEDFFAKRGIIIPIIQHNITRIKPEGFNDVSSPQQLHLNLTLGKSALNYPAAFDFKDQILIYHLHNDNHPFLKDDVSGLIYYQWISEDRKQKVEGYINTKGEFVLIKKPTRNAGF
ncbi:MAG: WG repeat-containing protein [Pedobacter sp.]|nr:MAG: WG repeat-containing protein [Pedobacter sp.]